MTTQVLALEEKDNKRINSAINQLAQGRSNAVGTVTLTVSAATTVTAATNCGSGSVVVLSPTTAHASAEFGNGTIFISAVANGSFTITHANNAQADRTFGWVALG